MKKRKLNNKGFTLIELLAVIVILAIVMGVAANAVLNVMNDSRKNTLQSSAKSAADAFRTAYAEYQLKNDGMILGLNASNLLAGDASNLLGAAKSLNLSAASYDLTNSKVYYDKSKGSFIVCLVAKENGSYYLATARNNSAVNIVDTQVGTGTSATYKITMAANTMWACSNDEHSWS